MSCHNIGHGLNEVVRKVLEEYDAGTISYEPAFRIMKQCTRSVGCCDGNVYEATACMYDRCGRCLRKGFSMSRICSFNDDQEIFERVDKEVISYHFCQDCLNKLEIQEFVDSPWIPEEWARFDFSWAGLL